MTEATLWTLGRLRIGSHSLVFFEPSHPRASKIELIGAIGGTLAGALDEDTAVITDGDVAIVAGTGAAHVVTAATDGTVSVRALTAGDRL